MGGAGMSGGDGVMGAVGVPDGVGLTGAAVARIAAEVVGRAEDGAASWAAVPGLASAAVGAGFADRGVRLAAAVEELRARGYRAQGRFGEYAPAVADQFGVFEQVDGVVGDAVRRSDRR